MIRVTCIDNREAEDFFTVGEHYEAIESNGEEITIENDDNGDEHTTHTCRFELYVSPATKQL